MAGDAKRRFVAESLIMTPEEEKFREDLDQLLTAARQEYARSGKPWLDWDGLEREIAERRGNLARCRARTLRKRGSGAGLHCWPGTG